MEIIEDIISEENIKKILKEKCFKKCCLIIKKGEGIVVYNLDGYVLSKQIFNTDDQPLVEDHLSVINKTPCPKSIFYFHYSLVNIEIIDQDDQSTEIVLRKMGKDRCIVSKYGENLKVTYYIKDKLSSATLYASGEDEYFYSGRKRTLKEFLTRISKKPISLNEFKSLCGVSS